MCSFIPSHMLDYVKKNTKSIETKALFTSAIDHKPSSLTPRLFAGNRPSPGGMKRTVYDAEERITLPGVKVRVEGGRAVKDKIVNDAYDFTGKTYEFFKNFFKRDSIDGKGFPLDATVHYSYQYPNAFYNGKQITFGDGDGTIFNNFCLLDITAHEWSHGVIDKTCGLVYSHQSGALNESLADVFGSMVKQFSKNQKVDKADWIIGEGLFTDRITGAIGIRSLKAPGTAYDHPDVGKDLQPDHMSKYLEGEEDSGNVHGNSGIPNHAFYLAAVNIGGFSWEKTGKIWYHTMTTKLDSNSQFQDFANATVQSAIELYGTGTEYKAVKEAWKKVGLTPRYHIFNQV